MNTLKERVAALVRRAQIMVTEPNNLYTAEGYVVWMTADGQVQFVDPKTGNLVNPS